MNYNFLNIPELKGFCIKDCVHTHTHTHTHNIYIYIQPTPSKNGTALQYS